MIASKRGPAPPEQVERKGGAREERIEKNTMVLLLLMLEFNVMGGCEGAACKN